MINRIIGLVLLIFIYPFFLIVSIIIFINDGFPAFYKQKRIGINNSKFLIYKFRTMKKDTPDIPTHQITDAKSLLIRSGYFIRKMSLDELPQLLNIIIGDMVFLPLESLSSGSCFLCWASSFLSPSVNITTVCSVFFSSFFT